MAIAYRASSAIVSTGSALLQTVTWPSGIQAGDVAVLFVGFKGAYVGANGALTDSADGGAGWSYWTQTGNGTVGLMIFFKTVTSSTTGTLTCGFQSAAGARAFQAGMIVFSGVDPVNGLTNGYTAIDNSAGANAGAGGNAYDAANFFVGLQYIGANTTPTNRYWDGVSGFTTGTVAVDQGTTLGSGQNTEFSYIDLTSALGGGTSNGGGGVSYCDTWTGSQHWTNVLMSFKAAPVASLAVTASLTAQAWTQRDVLADVSTPVVTTLTASATIYHPIIPRGAGTLTGSDRNTTIAVSYPASMQANDIAFLQVVMDAGNTVTSLSESGWTSAIFLSGIGTVSHGLWWKRLTGTPPASVTVTFNGGTHSTARIAGFGGVRTSGDPWSSLTSNWAADSTSVSTTVSPSGAGSRFFAAFAGISGNRTLTVTFDGTSGTLTQGVSQQTTGVSYRDVGVLDSSVAVALSWDGGTTTKATILGLDLVSVPDFTDYEVGASSPVTASLTAAADVTAAPVAYTADTASATTASATAVAARTTPSATETAAAASVTADVKTFYRTGVTPVTTTAALSALATRGVSADTALVGTAALSADALISHHLTADTSLAVTAALQVGPVANSGDSSADVAVTVSCTAAAALERLVTGNTDQNSIVAQWLSTTSGAIVGQTFTAPLPFTHVALQLGANAAGTVVRIWLYSGNHLSTTQVASSTDYTALVAHDTVWPEITSDTELPAGTYSVRAANVSGDWYWQRHNTDTYSGGVASVSTDVYVNQDRLFKAVAREHIPVAYDAQTTAQITAGSTAAVTRTAAAGATALFIASLSADASVVIDSALLPVVASTDANAWLTSYADTATPVTVTLTSSATRSAAAQGQTTTTVTFTASSTRTVHSDEASLITATLTTTATVTQNRYADVSTAVTAGLLTDAARVTLGGVSTQITTALTVTATVFSITGTVTQTTAILTARVSKTNPLTDHDIIVTGRIAPKVWVTELEVTVGRNTGRLPVQIWTADLEPVDTHAQLGKKDWKGALT